jgi:hypothetical protein
MLDMSFFLWSTLCGWICGCVGLDKIFLLGVSSVGVFKELATIALWVVGHSYQVLRPNMSSIDRLVNYADPLFENGSAQPTVQMRMQPPDIGKTARSPPSDMARQFRPSSSFQNYPPVQHAEPRDHVQR